MAAQLKDTLMACMQDRDVLRRLASEIAEIASRPEQEERRALWRGVNEKRATQPALFIYQVPWSEFEQAGELALACADPALHGVEQRLRRTLYQWRHFPGDMVVEHGIICPLVVQDSGFGIQQTGDARLAPGGSIYTQHFTPQITCEADVAKIEMPEVIVDWAATEQRRAGLDAIFEGILPVCVRGAGRIWFAPWDELIRWYGVEQALADMALRPELVHAAIERLVSAYLYRLRQLESQGALEPNAGDNTTGSGGLAFCGALPAPTERHQPVQPLQQWGCAAAQIFCAVSPEMHETFALQYELRWLAQFGLNYYGCCEPLHQKLHILKQIPRLRKVSMSPWADLNSAMEQGAGERYVLSIKPSPSFLAERTWELERAEADLRRILNITRGASVEIILKDIRTVLGEPSRLAEWAAMARRCIHELAG